MTQEVVPAAPARGSAALRWGVVALVAVGIGGGVFYSVRHKATVEAEPPRDVPTFDGEAIRFSPAYAERVGLIFAKVESGSLAPTSNFTGTVVFDPERVAVVGARVAGRIGRVFKFEGDHVKATDTLAELESAELGSAQSALLVAKAHLAAAEANNLREKHLAEAKVSSARDAELAHAVAVASKAEVMGAEQRVMALGGASASAVGVFRVTSPIAGKIVESHVSRGQSVDPSAMLFRVADLTRVWVELSVFERELAGIREGDEVELSPQTNAALVLKGKVGRVGDIIDLETRSTDVRIVVENANEMLRPGQSVTARIHRQVVKADGFLLPRDALTTVDGKSTVFVLREKDAVEPRTVVVGARDADRVQVTSGLTAGDTVVTKGVFALKAEIFR